MYFDWRRYKEWVKLLSYKGKAKCAEDKENHIISTSTNHIVCGPTEPRAMDQQACLEYLRHGGFLYSDVLSICVQLLLL